MLNLTNKKVSYWSNDILNKCNVILVSGKMKVGKTTFSKMLFRELERKNFTVTRDSFSRTLKDCAKEYFLWDGKKDERGRKLLQLIGTEVGRWYDNDLWVKHLVNKLNTERMFYPSFVIVDDWRFENEYQYLNDLNFEVFCVRIMSETLGEDNDHKSEHSIPENFKFDYIIDNSKDFDHLEDQAKEFVKLILERE